MMRDERWNITGSAGILVWAALAGVMACGMALIAGQACGQTATVAKTAPSQAKFAGCVQRLTTEKDTLVLSGDTVCAKLSGRFHAADLAGHEVELEGVLTERTAGNPARISVSRVTSVGESCSSTCALQPPGTRGLGKGGQTPGKEGGTPGVSAPIP
jgi:hypothetical protein